jgi:SAM-dependent methyltransferase
MTETQGPRVVVRRGYERAAAAYLAERTADSADVRALAHLTDVLAPDALVLDAGCGGGRPIAARLAAAGHRVVGVDFAVAQLALACDNVPAGVFVCQDLTALGLAPATFDAVCSYYAIIHVPRREHAAILAAFYRVLKPGGYAFLCLGAADLADDYDDNYFGVRMYWSHYDGPTNLTLLGDAGFEVLWSAFVSDSLGDSPPDAGHLFVLARKPVAGGYLTHERERGL